jgi:hypothetical protein
MGPAEHDHCVVLLNVTHFRGLIARRDHISKEHRVLDVQVAWDDRRADVGKRHPDILGLPTRVPTGGVRIPVDATHRCGLRVDVVAVAVELPPAK